MNDDKKAQLSEEELEQLWIEQEGIDPETGKMWLTPRQLREAEETIKTWNDCDTN